MLIVYNECWLGLTVYPNWTMFRTLLKCQLRYNNVQSISTSFPDSEILLKSLVDKGLTVKYSSSTFFHCFRRRNSFLSSSILIALICSIGKWIPLWRATFPIFSPHMHFTMPTPILIFLFSKMISSLFSQVTWFFNFSLTHAKWNPIFFNSLERHKYWLHFKHLQ